MTRPPLDRMIRIHAALQEGGNPNCSTLGRLLEVSTKTIQRDIEFMRDRLGLPIEFRPEHNGFRYTEEVDSFPTLQISEGELVALLVAEKALQQYRGTPFEKRLVGALRKLEQALPDTVSLNLADWDQSISFHTTAEPPEQVPAVLESLIRAAQRRQQLQLRYRKPGAAQEEERIVDPYQIANVNGDWYLFAFDHLRRDLRRFVPARIVSATPTGRTFTRPAKFELQKLLRDSFGVRSKEGDFEVVIRFESSVADYLREKRWHPSQVVEELEDGGVEVRLRLGSLLEIERWILSWGGTARVMAPPELIERVRGAAVRLQESHPLAGGARTRPAAGA